ncbi:MAG: hypothetical protein ABL880_05050 [Methylotenera sp.]
MNYQELKEKTKKWNQFANSDTLGSFDFYTYIVSLDSLTTNDISRFHKSFNQDFNEILNSKANLTPEEYEQLARILPLVIHEYTHFIDSTSTIWGLRHLNLMNEAYLSNNKHGGTEGGFIKAKRFYDHVRKIRLPDYYTTSDLKKKNKRPWGSTLTLGITFASDGSLSNEPVFFSNFSNFDGDLLVRSPISTVSILEASAMSQEIICHADLLHRTTGDFRQVEESNFTEQILSYLYNPKITEYSVCVHVLANRLNCKDILIAFHICSQITRLILNFPISAFDTLAEKCPITSLINCKKGDEYELRLIDGLRNHNLGILYYLICFALPIESYNSSQSVIAGISSAIKNLGLNFADLQNAIKIEADELHNATQSSKIASISSLSKAGYSNLKSISGGQQKLSFGSLNLPPVALSDSTQSEIFTSKTNQLQKFDLDSSFDELYDGAMWVNRFAEACI